VLREPAAIKALAHPARLAVMDQLMDNQARTATELAAEIGLSPSAMSYHLREMAKWKLVVEAKSNDGRERRWRLNPGGFAIDPAHPTASIAAEQTVVTRLIDRERDEIMRTLSRLGELPDEWRDAASLVTTRLQLTAPEVEELARGFQELIAPYENRRRRAKPSAGTRKVLVGFRLVPTLDEE
jgi:DNA-binding transcriptional ArsR family regulator